MLQAVQQRVRRRIGRRGKKHGSTGHALRRIANSDSGIPPSGGDAPRSCASSISRPRRQVIMTANTTAPSASGNQPPSSTLCSAAAKNASVDHGRRSPWRARRATADSASRSGRTKKVRSVVTSIVPITATPYAEASRDELPNPIDRRRDDDEQHPVDGRNVDLADRRARRVPDRHPRQVAELDRLLRHRIRAGDRRLRRDHRRRRGEHDHRVQRPRRDRRGRTDSRSPPGRAISSAPCPK